MSYTWNNLRIATPLTISSNQPEFVSETGNLTRLVSSQDAQRWELSFNVEPTTNAGNLFVAVTANTVGTQTMTMPQIYKSGATDECSTAALTNVSASAGQTSIQLVFSGTGEVGNKIYAGTFIKFSSHDKVYMVTADATATDNTTEALMTLSIYPALTSAIVASETVNYLDDVTLTYWVTDSLRGLTYNDGLAVSASLNIVEAI